jgi:glycogen debranching enzyme
LGLYVDAQRVEGMSDRSVTELLAPFNGHLREAGIGCISEIFDGDSPHAPNGCIAQAWSVAELLRIIRTYLPG